MNDNQKTPKWLMQFFKNFYDPCPLYPDMDGLTSAWHELNYVNPPYSETLEFVKKAIEESKKGKHTILLLRVDCSTKWYKILIENNAHFCYFNERLHFNDSKQSPSFSNMLVFL